MAVVMEYDNGPCHVEVLDDWLASHSPEEIEQQEERAKKVCVKAYIHHRYGGLHNNPGVMEQQSGG